MTSFNILTFIRSFSNCFIHSIFILKTNQIILIIYIKYFWFMYKSYLLYLFIIKLLLILALSNKRLIQSHWNSNINYYLRWLSWNKKIIFLFLNLRSFKLLTITCISMKFKPFHYCRLFLWIINRKRFYWFSLIIYLLLTLKPY